MKQNKLSGILEEKVRAGVGNAVAQYLSIPIDKRQEMESKGITLSSIIFEKIYPSFVTTKISSVLFVMEEGIGNMVMLTPAIRLLKHIHPGCKVTIWGKEPAVDVIRGWDLVDKVITEFDYSYYDLCYNTIWSMQTKATYAEILQNYCKGHFEVPLKLFHESLQYLAIAEFMDGYGEISIPHCEVAKDEKAEMVLEILKDKGIDPKKLIIFGDTTLRTFGWDRKKWPYYAELAKIINKKFPEYKIALIGDSTDKKEFEEKQWPENTLLDFCGNLDIQQTAYLISQANLYIGNDTGPTHIAAALGVKTFAIFGPTLLSKNKPIGKNVTVIKNNMHCSPCQYTKQWEECSDYECMGNLSAEVIYDRVFHSKTREEKKKVLLVGAFALDKNNPLQWANEHHIKKSLEKDFKFKVFPYDYRQKMKNLRPIDVTYGILNDVIEKEIDLVMICGGQQLVPSILHYIEFFSPKTKIFNWYVDNRGKIEDWFLQLSSQCTKPFWSTGDPRLLSGVFGKLQEPCEFLPITPDDNAFYHMEEEKIYDVTFVGTPHSPARVNLLQHLVKEGIKVNIFGNGDWPSDLQPYVKPGVFEQDFNKVLNQSKIVINTNIINEVPLYFSDRYFYPMATKTVGLNKRIPQIEEMFEDGKHMMLWDTHEDCVDKIKELLSNDDKRKLISEKGYKLYKEKYTLKHMIEKMLEDF